MRLHACRVLTGIFLFVAQMNFMPVSYAQNPSYDKEIPASLLPWKNWVLYGNERFFCPAYFNDADQRECVWPHNLSIQIQNNGAYFEYTLFTYIRNWVALPGGNGSWPQNVTVNGHPGESTMKEEIPFILLERGDHTIKGRFSWDIPPDMIQIPFNVGILSLFINGKEILSPHLDKNGKLWLRETERERKEDDNETVQIFRLIKDSIPVKMTSHISLKVSGSHREIKIENAFIEKTTPLSWESPLPLRYDQKGTVWVQAHPGNFSISFISRFDGPLHSIRQNENASDTEIWSFQPENHLRIAEISGVSAVEPTRTEMPSEWHKFPAYIVKPGDTLSVKEIKRGDIDPAPDRLSLKRICWLDFSGKGITIHDSITGTMKKERYLAMMPPISLGRVTVNNENQLITFQGKNRIPGVQIRHGAIQILADSRIDSFSGKLPAIGWDHDFDTVVSTLKIPPGYRLFSALGADRVSSSFLTQWSLLDIFIVLIFTLAIRKIKNLKSSFVAFCTLILIYHEPFAPRTVFLHLLIVFAIYPYLKSPWTKRLFTLWGTLAAIFLFAQVVPFMIHQIRVGMYPQLERTKGNTVPNISSMEESILPLEKEKKFSQGMEDGGALDVHRRTEQKLPASIYMASQTKEKTKAIYSQDPDALIQTGPGIPSWNWNEVNFYFNGPVTRHHNVSLILISPKVNLALNILRVMLLSYLIMIFFDIKALKEKFLQNIKPVATVFSLFVLLFFSPKSFSAESLIEYPPQFILEELRGRLLEKAMCHPYCADIPKMEFDIDDTSLRITAEVHALTETIIPLPCRENSFIPQHIAIEQIPLKKVMKNQNGDWWAVIPKGVHRLTVIGDLKSINELEIPLPLRPHFTSYRSKGWTVKGVHENGKADAGIQIIRDKKEEISTPSDDKMQSAPPFFHITRRLSLGMNWQVDRVIERVTPPGRQATLLVPLQEGESVTTPDIHVEKGIAQIHFKAHEMRFEISSLLKHSQILRLSAPEEVDWTESWTLDISPIWEYEFKGIPPVHHQDNMGNWQPEWKPFPGEEISISIQRLEAVPGINITIDDVSLSVTPGQRTDQLKLQSSIRTSKATQYTIRLPENSTIQTVKVDGATLPIQLNDQDLTIPLKSGSQKIQIDFQRLFGNRFFYRGPLIDMGRKAVNTKISFHLQKNRWILMVGGPRLGPCVLFWSYLATIIFFAVMLGRIPFTPLRTISWLLLSLGLTQISPIGAMIVIGWFIAVGLRERYTQSQNPLLFNTVQILLIILTLMAFFNLYSAIEKGLLGLPDMQIRGNNSSDTELIWTEDRIDEKIPRPWMFTLPIVSFHGVMLIWSLWLASSMMKWVKWAYANFNSGGFFKKISFKRKTWPNHTKEKSKESGMEDR